MQKSHFFVSLVYRILQIITSIIKNFFSVKLITSFLFATVALVSKHSNQYEKRFILLFVVLPLEKKEFLLSALFSAIQHLF